MMFWRSELEADEISFFLGTGLREDESILINGK